jgi:hypothetical protein
MDRRGFFKAGIAASGAGAVLPTAAMVSSVSAGRSRTARPGESPYGPLSTTPDENGLLLPEGFTSRVIAIGGERVPGTDYEWHLFPDGAATYDDGNDGWYYVCNSEVFEFMKPDSGGVSAIHFDADGSIIDAYRILEGSNSNCAGGPTPWGTWLSCEENFADTGRVWECDPTGQTPAVAHEAMGRWTREAAAVDPVDQVVYMTEDNFEGLLYRYTPDNYPDLSSGTLDACIIQADGTVSWSAVADPSGTSAKTREQVPGARVFERGEGIWYFDGWIYFCSTGDHSVHGIDLRNQMYTLIWKGDPEGLGVEGAVLSHVDNITVDEGSGDLVVAEDGGNMELVIITPDGQVAPFVRVVGEGHENSEMTGPVFNPARDRLYFSSQRGPSPRAIPDIMPDIVSIEALNTDGPNAGITYEISGPFRGRRVAPPAAPSATEPPPETTVPETTEPPPTTLPSPSETLASAAPEVEVADVVAVESSDQGGGSGLLIGGGIAAVAVAAIGGAMVFRQRRMGDAAVDTTGDTTGETTGETTADTTGD